MTKVKSSSVHSNSKSVLELAPKAEDKCTLEKNNLKKMLQNSLTDLAIFKKEKNLMSVEIAGMKKQLQRKDLEVQMQKRQGV